MTCRTRADRGRDPGRRGPGQALDGFEQFLRKKLDARREQLDKENPRCRREIGRADPRSQQKWRPTAGLSRPSGSASQIGSAQAIEERRLFDAVGTFVEQTVSLGSGADVPDAPGPQNPKG